MKYLLQNMKVYLPTLILLYFLGCTNNSNSSKPELKVELPTPELCKSNLGILKMGTDGYSVGKITELTELKTLLSDENCDVIEITYELKGSYGSNIPKKLSYDKREKRLKDIFTRTNVIEEYTNVSTEGLQAFLANGEKSFYSLTEYTDSKYDFNNREMKQTALGNKPAQSEWDGSVDIVKDFINSTAKDAASVDFIEWSKVSASGEYWIVRCKYKGANSIGVIATENRWFYIQNGKVVKTKEI